MLGITIAYYSGWFIVTLILSKEKGESPKQRQGRFLLTFALVSIIYAIFLLSGVFDEMLN